MSTTHTYICTLTSDCKINNFVSLYMYYALDIYVLSTGNIVHFVGYLHQ